MSSISPSLDQNLTKKGLLLINLGTPDDLTVKSIRRYLREFLSDPRVIDVPLLLRYLLVYGIILPFRPYKVIKAYREIWSAEQGGSPLRIHSLALADQLTKLLGNDYQVEIAMRYGNPSIANAVQRLSHCGEILVLPLFPQYSSAATGSAIAKTLTEFSKQWNLPKITVIDQFFAQDFFIKPMAQLIRPYLAKDPEQFLLFSYHGLPERHLDKSACAKSVCARKTACPAVGANNFFCYRAQCYQTSRLLAQTLNLNTAQYASSFQSRLGRIPWIKPYTDELIADLYKQGMRKLVVACPAFTADCLETLEEIGMQAKEQWLELGGESFELVPCLNSHPLWAEQLADWVKSINN